jgi:hypothetical protein
MSMIESLEGRKLLAATVSASGGVLTINGDGKVDVINVIETGGSVHVETSNPGGPLTQRDFTGITAIRINGRGAGDTIFYTGNSIGAQIHGDSANQNANPSNGNNGGGTGGTRGGTGGTGGGTGDGNNGGPNAGAGGADFITVDDAGTGSSVVFGDGGKDDITLLRSHNTTVFGGAGDDKINVNTAGQASSSAQVFGQGGRDTVTVYAGTNTLNGGAGIDTLIELGGTNSSSSFEVP